MDMIFPSFFSVPLLHEQKICKKEQKGVQLDTENTMTLFSIKFCINSSLPLTT